MSGDRRARSLVRLVALATLAAAWPRAAWALCPNCLGQQSALTPTLKLVGLFLLVPFAVAAVVYRVVRRTLGPRAANAHRRFPSLRP